MRCSKCHNPRCKSKKRHRKKHIRVEKADIKDLTSCHIQSNTIQTHKLTVAGMPFYMPISTRGTLDFPTLSRDTSNLEPFPPSGVHNHKVPITFPFSMQSPWSSTLPGMFAQAMQIDVQYHPQLVNVGTFPIELNVLITPTLTYSTQTPYDESGTLDPVEPGSTAIICPNINTNPRYVTWRRINQQVPDEEGLIYRSVPNCMVQINNYVVFPSNVAGTVHPQWSGTILSSFFPDPTRLIYSQDGDIETLVPYQANVSVSAVTMRITLQNPSDAVNLKFVNNSSGQDTDHQIQVSNTIILYDLF